MKVAYHVDKVAAILFKENNMNIQLQGLKKRFHLTFTSTIMRNKQLLDFELFILLPPPPPCPNSSSIYAQPHPHGRIKNFNKRTEKENYFLTQV